ncbi:hypothetical protein CNMCM8980_001029 [Aspergillus fumigatiaffinis]|nr:hypothetical protein CNMCM8980_001029 [Aspergillus fumigatiaffinis]
MDPQTRLVIATPQGANKIYRTEDNRQAEGRLGLRVHDQSDMSRQTLDIQVGGEAALCYLPDPCVPFRHSRYEQVQTFTIDASTKDSKDGSICVLDWVTQGRAARGENWDFHLWKGRNEVWSRDKEKDKRRLLIRDSVILDDEYDEVRGRPRISLREHTGGNEIIGTLILYGPVFGGLASFMLDRFASQKRIGAQNWSSSVPDGSESSPHSEVIWTAAQMRGGTVVKFGTTDSDAAKQWLGGLLREEGSVAREFGESALFCL